MKRHGEQRNKSLGDKAINYAPRWSLAVIAGVVVAAIFTPSSYAEEQESIEELRSDVMEQSYNVVLDDPSDRSAYTGMESIVNEVYSQQGEAKTEQVIDFQQDEKNNIIRFVRGYDKYQGLDSSAWYLISVDRDKSLPDYERVKVKELFDANERTDRLMGE